MLVGLLTRGGSALSPLGHHGPEIVTGYLLNLVAIAVLISIWEEGAWMGFVTARLQRRWGPAWASVAVAPLFGFVHFPLFFIVGGLMDGGRPQGGQIFEYAFYLLILFSVPVRILITWVYNSAGGSLPVVALLHASIDTTASAAVLTTFYPDVDGRLLYVAIAVVALGLVVITRGRLGYREEEVGSPAPLVPEPSPA